MRNNIIEKITIKAGQTWNPLLMDFCLKHNYKGSLNNQQQDLVIYFFVNQIRYILAFELKHKDKHSTLFGQGEGGKLDDELVQSYLPYRENKTINEVFLILSSYPTEKELYVLTSICSKYRVPIKFYSSQEKAIEGIFRLIEDYAPIKEINCPTFMFGEKGYSTLTRMLRRFFSVEQLEQIAEAIKEYNYLILEHREDEIFYPIDYFTKMELILKDLRNEDEGKWDNIYRRWYDWWNGGIEPKENTLS